MKDLPDLVWLLIIDHLRPSFEWDYYLQRGPSPSKSELAGIAALASLCRTSSHHRALAEPALYRGLPAAHAVARRRVFATLARRPRLAQHVRALCVGDEFMTRDEFVALVQRPVLAAEDPAVASLAGRLTALGDGLPDYSAEFPDAWSAYAVLLMPRLEFLDVTLFKEDTLLPAVFRDVTRDGQKGNGDSQLTGTASVPAATTITSRPLSQLKEICIRRAGDIRGALRMRLFQDVLLLPRLQRLHGQCVQLDTNLASSMAPRVSSLQPSSVREVTLDWSLVETAGLLDLLRACPLLQWLSICWGDSIVGESKLAWDGFGDALRQHGSNLQTLHLDCRLCLVYDMGEWSGRIGDLSVLRRLKHLSQPQDILVGNQDELSGLTDLSDDEIDDANDQGPDIRLEPLLPDSLESIRLYTVYDDEAWVNTAVQGLLESERLSRLGRMQLDNVAELNIDPPQKAGWETKITGGQVVFSCNMPVVVQDLI